MIGSVFICYSRKDEDFVFQLATSLKRRGVSVWLDQWDIPSGADWNRAIEKALEESTRLLLILSPSSIESDQVQCEWLSAIDEKKVVIPILYQPCHIPHRLKAIQYIDFTSRSPDNEEAIGQILNALGMAGSTPIPQPEQAQVKSQNNSIQNDQHTKDHNAPIFNKSTGSQVKIEKDNIIPKNMVINVLIFVIMVITAWFIFTNIIHPNNSDNSDVYGQPSASSPASLQLTVLDEDTNAPIPNARITGTDGQNNELSPSPAITDSNGQVTISGIQGNNDWQLKFSSPGYIIHSISRWVEQSINYETVKMSKSSASSPSLASLLLGVAGDAQITAGSDQLSPIPNARITGTDGQGNELPLAITNSSGLVTINGEPGTWNLTVSAPGYDNDLFATIISVNPGINNLESKAMLTHNSPASLQLTVLDMDTEAPIPNAQITVTGWQNSVAPSQIFITNNRGQVTINGVSGRWDLMISAPGYDTSYVGFRIEPGINSQVVYSYY